MYGMELVELLELKLHSETKFLSDMNVGTAHNATSTLLLVVKPFLCLQLRGVWHTHHTIWSRQLI